MSVASRYVEWRPSSFWRHPRVRVGEAVTGAQLFLRGDAIGVRRLGPNSTSASASVTEPAVVEGSIMESR